MTNRVPYEEQELSRRARLPVQDENASVLISIQNEVVQLIVGSTNSNDVGSDAGTIVYGRLKKGNILDSMGDRLASENDTSVVLGASPFATFKPFDWKIWQANETESRSDKLDALTEDWVDGDYTMIPDSNIIIGKKDSTETTATVTYAVREKSVSSRLVDLDGDTIGDAENPLVSSASGVERESSVTPVTTAIAATTSFLLVAANADRKSLDIKFMPSDPTANFWLSTENPATSANAQETMRGAMNLQDAFPFYSGAIYAKSDVASGSFQVTEY